MIEESCPECPQCHHKMIKDANGLCKCTNPECGAVLIPKGCTGVFVPLSFIGIH